MTTEVGRLVRYGVVGASNTAITLVAYLLLARAGVPGPPASATAFALGAANGYAWNRRWTFGVAGGDRGMPARYVAVQALGAGLSALGLWAVSRAGAPRTAAELLVVPCVTVVTYVLSRRLVFRSVIG